MAIGRAPGYQEEPVSLSLSENPILPLALLYHSNFPAEQTRARFEPRLRTRSRTWNDLYREILTLLNSSSSFVRPACRDFAAEHRLNLSSPTCSGLCMVFNPSRSLVDVIRPLLDGTDVNLREQMTLSRKFNVHRGARRGISVVSLFLGVRFKFLQNISKLLFWTRGWHTDWADYKPKLSIKLKNVIVSV